MGKSDSDIEMISADGGPSKAVSTSPNVRSGEEKLAFRESARKNRDAQMGALGDAWLLLGSAPSSQSRLLKRSDFPDHDWARLSKGRGFLTLARMIGCSSAVKSMREQFRRAGKTGQHGEDEAFDAIIAPKEQIMARSGDAPQQSRRSSML